MLRVFCVFFFFSSRRRHTRFDCDWSSDVCSSDLEDEHALGADCFGNGAAKPLQQIMQRRDRGQDLRRLADGGAEIEDRKSTRLNSSHSQISYAVFCLKKKK